jgi:hypothetical protein
VFIRSCKACQTKQSVLIAILPSADPKSAYSANLPPYFMRLLELLAGYCSSSPVLATSTQS